MMCCPYPFNHEILKKSNIKPRINLTCAEDFRRLDFFNPIEKEHHLTGHQCRGKKDHPFLFDFEFPGY